MPTYRLLLLLLSLLLITPAHAQENLPTPLDPAQIFSDDVEVVETLPLYIAERDRVSFYNYDTGEWHTYPFPDFPLLDGEIAAAAFRETPQGAYLLSVEYYTPCTDNCPEIGDNSIDYIPPHAAFVRERWHFDRDTGEFTPFEAICGGYARALPEEGEWVTFSSNSETYLCNTETGQTSAPLSTVTSIPNPALLNSPSLSADSRWLVFMFYYSLDVFAYDFVEDTLISLGTMTSTSVLFTRDYPRVNWIDDHNVVLENFTSNYGDEHFYLYQADVSQAGSLELFYHSGRNRAFPLENTSHYVWYGRQFDDTPMWGTPPPPEEDCEFHEYSVIDGTIRSYAIPHVCSFGVRIPDGSGDYLTTQSPYDMSDSLNLVRFNLVTGASEQIPIGSYDGLTLSGPSPDGHYVVMTIYTGSDNYQIAVFDHQARTLLEPLYPSNDGYVYVYWINDHTFWRALPSSYTHNELYSISAAHISIQPTDYSPTLGDLYENQFLLITNDAGTLDILNVETLETITIAQTPNGEIITGQWEDDGTILISVWQNDVHRGRLGRWRVRVHL